jgi:extradiol dioxygenase
VSDLRLGYVGITSEKLAEWGEFSEVFGFGTRAVDDDALYLCMDGQHHRLAIHRGEREALSYIGWDVGNAEQLEQVRDTLEGAELVVEVAKDELCEQRHVTQMITVDDPSGFRHELFCEPLIRPRPFQPGRPMAGGFVTGDQGLGHVVLGVPDLEAARDFYLRLLGFRKSDWAGAGPMVMDFLHANPRHHSVALLEFPGMRGLQHLMIEVEDIDDVGIALDLCGERGYEVPITLGRHHVDRMVSFYARTPSNFDLEYGWGAITVDDERSPGHFDEPSLWGHKFTTDTMGGALHPVD